MELPEPRVVDNIVLGVTMLLACLSAPSFFHVTIALLIYWIGTILAGIEDKMR